MDPARIRDICNAFSAKDYFVAPVPPSKAKYARMSLGIRSSETILAMIDFTVFGGAEESFVTTENGICWKCIGDEKPQRLNWQQLAMRDIREKKGFLSKSIDFGDGVEMSLSGATDLVQDNNHLVLELLTQLKTLASSAPEGAVAVEAGTGNIGLVTCDYCKKRIKPSVTFCKYCGTRLAG